MRTLLVTIGSHGDIHPFIAVARALKDRGHEAALLTNPHFAPVIEHAGLECLPIGEDIDIKELIAAHPVMHAHKGPMTVLRELMLPLVRQVHDATRDALRAHRADACISHPICMGASWACERAGVPHDVVALSPTIWFNPHDRLVMSPWLGPRPVRITVRAQCFIGRFALRAALDRGLNRERRDLGLPPVRNAFLNEATGGRHNLALWSPHFRAPLDGDPPTARICGFAWHDTVRDPDPERERLEKFLADGPAPIVFTLGTAAVHDPGDFYAQALRACELLDRRAILLMGRPEYIPRELPRTIAAFAYAPYSRLLPRAAATVHHAGVGTTAQVLRSGRPSVPVPFAHDQFDNSARLERLGVARTVKKGRRLAERLADALRAVLEDPSFAQRSANLAPEIAREDGAAVAADLISGAPPSPAAPSIPSAPNRPF